MPPAPLFLRGASVGRAGPQQPHRSGDRNATGNPFSCRSCWSTRRASMPGAGCVSAGQPRDAPAVTALPAARPVPGGSVHPAAVPARGGTGAGWRENFSALTVLVVASRRDGAWRRRGALAGAAGSGARGREPRLGGSGT